ncbi:LIC10604 family protein [Leptospira kmetyi]|uniref:LIC10604 family protein n=1 Tax=Leptospira kmetyi TaxID=408139 RepID=UPI0002897A18|nr:SRPBCC family protein [Leptospira kmetyi]EQA53560.1 polyketide cyclase/dehydrase and lipid transport [Leptospira kmetyi serovar Malaysia str. Bejo-Iso9]TGK16578.1 polyketide cyclase [Leptospira kmetyi]TGK34019.1 polyketide cyclase [Leptospira kmetyi]
MIGSILLYALGFLILLGFGVYGLGASLPVEHSSSLERVFKTSPNTIYSMIRDFKQYPTWRPNLKHIDEISPASWKETDSHKEIMTYSFIRDQKDALIESKIMDEDKPFGGSWTFEIASVEGGTKLKITENGKVFSPVFRFFSKFVFGHTATMQTYLDFMEKEVQRREGR